MQRSPSSEMPRRQSLLMRNCGPAGADEESGGGVHGGEREGPRSGRGGERDKGNNAFIARASVVSCCRGPSIRDDCKNFGILDTLPLCLINGRSTVLNSCNLCYFVCFLTSPPHENILHEWSQTQRRRGGVKKLFSRRMTFCCISESQI